MAVPKGYKLLGGGEGGSFATVYKVRHIESGYVRAIRELKDHIVAKNKEELEKNEIYKKFIRETGVLLKLGSGSHPYIERINTFGTFTEPDNPYEYIAYWERNFIQGENLKDYLEENSNFVSVDEVIRLATQISSALAYCHEDAYSFLMNPEKDNLPDGCLVGDIVDDEAKRKELIETYKVIHNDIHLKNILRRTDGNFLLIDFGMAVEGKEAPTFNRCHGGAEISRAPELWDSNSKTAPTTKTDVYSFGVVLYTWLAGQYPFPNDETLMEKHKNERPPFIEPIRKKYFEEKFSGQTYKRDYPKWLEDAIQKCLEKDPANRFRNGKELYEFVLAHSVDSYNGIYEVEIEQLKSKNDNLMSDNETLSAQLSDMRQTNASLNRQLNSTQNAFNHTQQTLRDTQDRQEKLRHQLNKSRIPLWILLTLFGLWGFAVSFYAWNNSETELNKQLEIKDQEIVSANDEINELKATITDLQNGVGQSESNMDESAEIKRLTNLVAQKDQKIKGLENQISKQKPVENSAEVTRLNNLIEQKNKQIKELESQLSSQKTYSNSAELNRLNNIITQQNQRIQVLESKIEDKNKEIKALNDVIGGKTNK